MQYTFFKTKHIFSLDQPAKVILIDAVPGWGGQFTFMSVTGQIISCF